MSEDAPAPEYFDKPLGLEDKDTHTPVNEVELHRQRIKEEMREVALAIYRAGLSEGAIQLGRSQRAAKARNEYNVPTPEALFDESEVLDGAVDHVRGIVAAEVSHQMDESYGIDIDPATLFAE